MYIGLMSTSGKRSLAAAILHPLVVLLLPLFAVSCGGASSGLDGDLKEIENLLKNKDCKGLYGHLSTSSREQVKQEQFVEMCKHESHDFKNLLQDLKDSRQGKKDKKKKKLLVRYHASVTLKSGEVVELVFEGGQWKIDSMLTEFYPQTTPKEAIESFVKAFEAGRWDVLARLMPSQYVSQDDAKIIEEHWSSGEARQQMQQVLTVLRDHLNDEIKVEGNRAVLEFAPQHKVELMKERGLWTVVHIF
jgi:hypothetical protein